MIAMVISSGSVQALDVLIFDTPTDITVGQERDKEEILD